MPRDPYEVLGVSRSASDDDIRKAYRNLARQHHPDRNPGDKQAEAKFKEIQEANDLLSDKAKRAQFDQFGFAGAGPSGFPGGFPGGFQGNVDPEQAHEIFGQLFGGGLGDLFGRKPRGGGSRGGRRPAPSPPPQAHELRVPFLTAAQGGTMSLRIDGRGVDVKIPAGIEEGKTLRVAGQGPGGADLHLRVMIEPHSLFRRDGQDVSIEVPLTVAEAILGAKVDVPTLDGSRLSVKIPPGTSSGPRRLRLRGKGIQGGDQYIDVKVVVPAPADDKAVRLVEEFAKQHPQSPRSGPPWE